MPTDPDQVRVDLLRIKRMIYTSYPEGSKERKDFVIAAKMSELTYLQNLVAPETIDFVYGEYSNAFNRELIQFLISTLIGSCLSFILLALHQLHQTNVWFYGWYIPFVVGLCFAGSHVYHAILNWKQIQPFKKEYKIIQNKIAKILEDLKGLTK